MKNTLFLVFILFCLSLRAQIDNTIYGLYKTSNSSGFKLAKCNPLTGQITSISSSEICSLVNTTNSNVNPYNQTFSFQDEDSWLTVNLQTGQVTNDVTVSLPNGNGNFNNFRFNASDSKMYGLYSETIQNPTTGQLIGDLRLATCDIMTGSVTLISSNSIATNYTATGNAIDPYLMLYYFQSEGKFIGVDLYNGEIYSQPTITFEESGTYFENIAYSCVDTTIYGLIFENSMIKGLGKINPQTGVVSALPVHASFENIIFNSGAAIDAANKIYYFQTMDNTVGQSKFVGLSLEDGSVVSQSFIGTSSDDYFLMYRIQSECYATNPTRFNTTNNLDVNQLHALQIYPNPAKTTLKIKSQENLKQIEIIDLLGNIIYRYDTNQSDFELPVENLITGVYYLRVNTSDFEYTERFVKSE